MSKWTREQANAVLTEYVRLCMNHHDAAGAEARVTAMQSALATLDQPQPEPDDAGVMGSRTKGVFFKRELSLSAIDKMMKIIERGYVESWQLSDIANDVWLAVMRDKAMRFSPTERHAIGGQADAVSDEDVLSVERAFWPAYLECKRTHGVTKDAHATGMRAALESFAARHARGAPDGQAQAEGCARSAAVLSLEWIIKHCNAPEKAAWSKYRGIDAIQHKAEHALKCLLAAQPTKDADQ